MPPKSIPLQQPPLLPALLLLLTSLTWPILEYLAIQDFESGLLGYNLSIESLSDLGVDYRQVHPLKHYNVTSYAYYLANANFIQAGVCFAVAQIGILAAARGRLDQSDVLRTVRLLLAVLYGIGMVLFGVIHGGPREKHWQIIGWHWMGLGMAAVAGNLNSIIAALGPGGSLYQLVSFVLGVVGLYGFYGFQTLGKWNFETKIGLYQRAAMYPVLVWNLFTAVAMLRQRRTSGVVGKGKKA